MIPIRREVQSFAIDCEKLMASYLAPDLTTDEKALIVYYVRELAEKFDTGPRNPTAN